MVPAGNDPPPVRATVMAGHVTVSVTTLVSTEPQLLVYVALNFFPLSLSGGEYVSVGDVAPKTLLKFNPPSVDTFHCTEVKLVAAEVKVTGLLAVTLCSVGCVVIAMV